MEVQNIMREDLQSLKKKRNTGLRRKLKKKKCIKLRYLDTILRNRKQLDHNYN